jgi:hypothetical protein
MSDDMTVEEAYRKGQYDMRQRIIKQWAGWITNTIGGHHRALRGGRKGYSNVAVEIRARCRVLPLSITVELPEAQKIL